MLADSLNISNDTLVKATITSVVEDSTEKGIEVPEQVELDSVYTPAIEKVVVEKPVVQVKAPVELSIKETLVIDTIAKPEQIEQPLFTLFSSINNKDSSLVQLSYQNFKNFTSELKEKDISFIKRSQTQTFEKSWVLGVLLFVVLLFLILRIYYHKYISTIFTSIVNIQIADKLLREKNVLTRRVFLLLNINYVIVLGLFFYQVLKREGVQLEVMNEFVLYIYILLVFILLIIIRLAIVWLTAFLFDAVPVFKDYIHNSLLISKNLGIYLLPVMLSLFYIEQPYNNILYIIASCLVIASLLYRYFRGVQIIMKHNVFLFYSILYLCTLEILPVLMGIKFVLTLR